MITEDYVSFEVAKLLKEKGFDEPVTELNKLLCREGEKPALKITHQKAMKWLREMHNIFIVIEPHMYDYINEKNSSYVTSLWQGDNYYENITSKDYPTYEQAVEAALKYCLENLI
jgi:hypothetical protein